MISGERPYASVWVITKQGQLHKVDTKGHIGPVTEANIALNVSYGADGTLWLIPVNKGSESKQLWYSENDGEEWKILELPNHSASGIAATHLGSCFLLTPQGAVYLVQKRGELTKVFNEGTANDMAISPEGFIWLISRQKKHGGGNLVFWCSIGNYVLQPAFGQPVAKKISAGPDGTARIITLSGEVGSLYPHRMGGLETPGGEPFAKQIAASNATNTIWVIDSQKIKNKKLSMLKYWNPDVDPFSKWHVIDGIEPILLTGGA